MPPSTASDSDLPRNGRLVRERSAATDISRAALRDESLEGVDGIIEAATRLEADLRVYHASLELYRRHLDQGGLASEMPFLIDIATIRTSVSDRMNELERARSGARLSLWRLQSAEGTPIAEIARAWGLSRQLVSRSLAASTTRRSVE